MLHSELAIFQFNITSFTMYWLEVDLRLYKFMGMPSLSLSQVRSKYKEFTKYGTQGRHYGQ